MAKRAPNPKPASKSPRKAKTSKVNEAPALPTDGDVLHEDTSSLTETGGMPDIPEATAPDLPPAANAKEEPHQNPLGPGGSGMPAADLSRVAPRAQVADAFESNPRQVQRAAFADDTARHELNDSTRVREALRSVIEEGDSLKAAAKEWNVAPSAIAEWRSRYQDLLREDTPSGTPLMEIGGRPQADTIYIPEAAREMFLRNWERLVTETAATPSDFVQSPRQIFLQTSPLTSWLFQEGRLDRGIVAGAISGLIGLALLTSFLIADRSPGVTVLPPEPAPRDDLVIDDAAVVAQSFFKAANWEERLKFVRQPEAVRSMMQEYYQTHPDGPINDAALSLALPVRHLVNLSFEIPSLNRSHFLCIVLLKGRHLVDWESSSLFQEEQIHQLRAARSPLPVRIAVTVAKKEDNSYYNYAFSDASRWECYQLGYPGLNLNLFGYAVKDSPDAAALDAMLGIVDKQAAVLEVRFPPDSQTDNQVEIVSVLRSEWVPSDP